MPDSDKDFLPNQPVLVYAHDSDSDDSESDNDSSYSGPNLRLASKISIKQSKFCFVKL